jgi:hypothetical protein
MPSIASWDKRCGLIDFTVLIPRPLRGPVLGFLFTLPDRLVPTAPAPVPMAQEVVPGIGAIGKLWDDSDFEAYRRALALAEARPWDAGQLGERYEQFFGHVLSGGPQSVSPAPDLRSATWKGSANSKKRRKRRPVRRRPMGAQRKVFRSNTMAPETAKTAILGQSEL